MATDDGRSSAAAQPTWPAGHRAALCLTFDVDGPYGEANDRHPADTRWIAQTAYDPVGAARLMNLLADTGVVGTFCWVARAAEDQPDLVKRAVADGHEVALHSWDHHDYTRMSEEEQRVDMERSRDALTKIAGVIPTGLKSPGGHFTVTTHEIAQQLGLSWVMDIPGGDQPYLLQPDTNRSPLVQLSPSWLWDDYSFYVEQTTSPDQVFTSWRDDLDVIRDEGGLICLTMHPYISGRPGPSRTVARLIDYAIDLGDVWIARADHITRWWLEREGVPITGE